MRKPLNEPLRKESFTLLGQEAVIKMLEAVYASEKRLPSYAIFNYSRVFLQAISGVL